MSTDSKPGPEPSPEWRELAHQASQEPDGQKVTELVRKICDTLDQEEAERKKKAQAAHAGTALTPPEPDEQT